MVERLPSEELTRRQKQIVHEMVFCSCSVEEACKKVGFRLRRGRDLLQNPVFVAEYSKVLSAHRSGEAAKSVATLVEIRDDRLDGTAAAQTARLKASLAILGENRAGVSVTVNNSNRVSNMYTPGYTIQPVAGYVLDLSYEIPAERPIKDVTPPPSMPVAVKPAKPKSRQVVEFSAEDLAHCSSEELARRLYGDLKPYGSK